MRHPEQASKHLTSETDIFRDEIPCAGFTVQRLTVHPPFCPFRLFPVSRSGYSGAILHSEKQKTSFSGYQNIITFKTQTK